MNNVGIESSEHRRQDMGRTAAVTFVRVTRDIAIPPCVPTTFDESFVADQGHQVTFERFAPSAPVQDFHDLLARVGRSAERETIMFVEEGVAFDLAAIEGAALALSMARAAPFVTLSGLIMDAVSGESPFELPEALQLANERSLRLLAPTLANPLTLLSCALFTRRGLETFREELLGERPRSEAALAEAIRRRLCVPREGARCSVGENAVTIPFVPKPNVLAECAANLYESGAHREALHLFEDLLERCPEYPGARYNAALCRAQTGNVWESRRDVEKELERTPVHEASRALLTHLDTVLPRSGEVRYEQVEGAIDTVTGYLDPGQERLLFDIVKSLPKDAHILEIGAHYGRSTVSMAFACVGTNRRITVIDPWDGLGPCSAYPFWRRNLERFGLLDHVTPLPGYSRERLAEWNPDTMIDFVFIDGAHWWKDVRADFMEVYPLVKVGGWMAFHDITFLWPGCYRAWRQLARPVLEHHRFVTSLACGQKVRSFAPPAVPEASPFSFSADLVEFTLELGYRDLAEAMRRTVDRAVSESLRAEAERTVGAMPDAIFGPLLDHINETVKGAYRADMKGRLEDGVVAYWASLAFERRGNQPYGDALRRLALTADVPHQA